MNAATRALCACAVLPFAAAVGGASAGDERSTSIRVLKPEADTYVSAAEPDGNFGHSLVLRADGSPQAVTYLRFRLKKTGRRAGSVTLLLHAHAGGRRVAFAARRVPRNDWREGEVTYATAPRPSLRYASSEPVRLGGWSAVDVTPFVVGDEDRVTLAVTTRNRLGLTFRSRESRQGPMLVVRTGRESAQD